MEGIIAAPGMALAAAHIAAQPEQCIEKHTIANTEKEMLRFRCATYACYAQIEKIISDINSEVDSQTAEILDFQLLLLEDTDFIGEIENVISRQQINAEYAVEYASGIYQTKLENITDNDYLRERAADVSDLSQRLIAVLSGAADGAAEPDGPYIAIGRDIPPSRVAELDHGKLKGIILEEGGVTSHCVILARSLGIPCLIKTTGILKIVKPGDAILLDAVSGEAVINPDASRTLAFNDFITQDSSAKEQLSKYINMKSETADGTILKVYANITMSAEADSVVAQGGEGVGLFRSELLYMAQNGNPPSEETQYEEYSRTAKALGGRPLVIRTLDIGGDKQIDYIDIGHEENPFLGYRAIRYCLDHPEIFTPQISAILRSGADGNVWMMFPMITCKEELHAARQIVRDVASKLTARRIPFDSEMKIGMMVETPAAAADAMILAKEADFFSIGTNDLSQYLFAADRANAKLAGLSSPYQPALLRAINGISAAACDAGIEVDICGQAAEIDDLIPLWLAMGITNLSVSIPRITAVRKRICSLDKSVCAGLLDYVLSLETAGEVEQALKEF